jgi:ubiquinone/menaquinone biosynthesis C-methylase UbiE
MTLKDTYALSEIHDQWESIYRGNPIENEFNDRIADRIIHYLDPPPNALFLDAGCGIGDHSIRIAARGYRCLGVDISEDILRRAKKNVAARGLESKVSFVCQGLEDMALPEAAFDVVHCRGVLMHIPEWDKALANLCRVLKPGGKIVILENNHRSLETAIVLLVRRIRARKSKMIDTPAGPEFWSKENGRPFLVRIANIACLARELETCGVRHLKTIATGFWGMGRFPAGFVRNTAVRCNQLYFSLGLPASFSVGNAVIGEKTSSGNNENAQP